MNNPIVVTASQYDHFSLFRTTGLTYTKRPRSCLSRQAIVIDCKFHCCSADTHLAGERLVHDGQILGQRLLAAQLQHAHKMVDFLRSACTPVRCVQAPFATQKNDASRCQLLVLSQVQLQFEQSCSFRQVFAMEVGSQKQQADTSI